MLIIVMSHDFIYNQKRWAAIGGATVAEPAARCNCIPLDWSSLGPCPRHHRGQPALQPDPPCTVADIGGGSRRLGLAGS